MLSFTTKVRLAMLLDNENKNLKVHEWISKYTKEGNFSTVTGYFTIGALAYFAKATQDKISAYRFVLGDIVNIDAVKDRSLDLLNENISIEAALQLSALAKEAVKFLKLDKVKVKTLEPNFCHAKAYIYKDSDDDPQKDFYITGSSNLTEAGTGLKMTNNVELNIAGFGSDLQYNELATWFDNLWTRPQAHKEKTILEKNGKVSKIPFKTYLINEINKIFWPYTPRELYYKVLFELFGDDLLFELDNPEFTRKIGRLENTEIYNALYDFQQKGVLSLIKMLEKYNGAILADAVGLGKTWSALAVMKYYELQGREVILICPKKLQFNWVKYRRHQHSRFESDQFEYFIRFHSDLTESLLSKYYHERKDHHFVNKKPKLFVIDESHNLRNDKSQRYKYLLEEIFKKNEDAKVLMLSATPINNSLQDIRNQFKLIVSGNPAGFEQSLDIKNIDYLFRSARKIFKEWAGRPDPKIAEFVKELPPNFFKLTDALVVARTRKMIEGQQNDLKFPKKDRPENIFVTPKEIGNYESFEELFDHFPPMLSGYQPAFYVDQADDVDKLHDEKQRDRFLVKMMYILMVKRLESSWSSFQSTVNKILSHHQNALDKIKEYQERKKDSKTETNQIALFEDDELGDEVEELTLGKRRPISLSEIDRSGNIEPYKSDLKKDIESLQALANNIAQFEKTITKEVKKPRNPKSEDVKLQKLMEIIVGKRKKGANNNNQKVLIFTVYKDTALYLFEQLKQRGFNNLAMVSGDTARLWNEDHDTKLFEPILERFAPFTKLFRENKWDHFQPSENADGIDEQYNEWIEWTSEHEPDAYSKLQNPIDILIATDVLSEGQNLQDCDMVINYDIHWNPVRIIQRMGRIDRLGSPNSKIFGINFWPSDNINEYLNLQGRIEQRMTAMKLAGSEVDDKFSDTFRAMAEDESLEQRQKAKMLEQMKGKWEDLEQHEKTLGFDNLSLETFRQELMEELRSKEQEYKAMPKAIYTGYKAIHEPFTEQGIIALLGYPAKPPKVMEHTYTNHELIYIDKNGKPIVANQKEVLDALALHHKEERFVPQEIDHGNEDSIKELADSLQRWLKSQAVEEEVLEDGTLKERMGSASLNLLDKLKKGSKQAAEDVKNMVTPFEKYKKENFDLITWFIVSKG